MPSAPSGTVTFLFTDIEGSTQLWERSREQMRTALQQHDALLRAAIEANDGYVFKTVGDAFFAAFSSPMQGLAAAVAAQQALQAADWPETGPLWVRMSLHTGVAEHRDNDYFGPALNRVARLLSAAHGGQVLLSSTVNEFVGAELPPGVLVHDLGEHRLKDLDRPVRIYELVVAGLRSEFPALRTLESRPNNLPVQITRFVGREREMGEVKDLLDRSRVLTLLGGGGMGKTRLALQVAAEVVERYPDGVWWVALAEITEAELVTQAVADALGVREEPGVPTLSALNSYLKPRELLLVLDNCEQVIGAAADLIKALLRAAPAVRVLATSREALNIPGEVAWSMPPLPVPDLRRAGHDVDPLAYASVALFVDRATATRPDFALSAQNLAIVADICRRLDGIALAIELAAARVRVLSAEQILSRLDDRFRLLAGSDRRAGVPHQQTLRAAIDWSYDLLTDDEQRLLRRLGVFRGGWTLEAAEAVGAATPDEAWEVLDLLGQLVDKSLVVTDDDGLTVRYRMLETIREYGLMRLAEDGTGETVAERHANWFLALAEEAAAGMNGPEQAEWLRRLTAEHENLRAALAWLESRPDGAERALRLAGSLVGFWQMKGHLSEGRIALSRALAQPSAPDSAAKGLALSGAGELAFRQGDYVAARRCLEDCETIRRALGDDRGVAYALRLLGNVADERGDYQAAADHYSEALAIWQDLNDPWGIASIGNNLGIVARRQLDFPLAIAYFERSLQEFEALESDWHVGIVHANLADVAVDSGDLLKARSHYEHSLAVGRSLDDLEGIQYALIGLSDVARLSGDFTAARAALAESLVIVEQVDAQLGRAEWIEACAALAVAEGRHVDGIVLYAAAAALREQIAAPLPATRVAERDANLSDAAAAMDASVANAAQRSGARLAWSDLRQVGLRNAVVVTDL